MEAEELARIRQRIEDEVRGRMPGAPIKRVEFLQYGDEPEIEPGQFLARVVIDTPDDTRDDEAERERVFERFHDENREPIHELRRDLDKLRTNVVLMFVEGGERREGQPRHVIKLGGGPGAPLGGGPGLTPVMARLGADDLDTLDTLITAGIASSRAEGVRWALARIRERPAYEQIREHARQIEDLRSQF
ncbi:MAG TPA: hypothetical protein VK817_13550 [Trebonia sp.]|jgi:hypothetical protein|nr:hypothetical protein [Trebonia sp.]